MPAGWLLAHVLAPPGNHLVFLWPASAALGVGLVLAGVARRRSWRRLWGALSVLGLMASVLVYVLEPSYAPPPAYTIRLVVATGPGDAAVQVCAVAARGATPVAVLPPGDLLDVFVDGKVHAEGPSPRFLVPLPPGRHTFSADMVQSNHVAFLPAEVTQSVSAVVPPGAGTLLPSTTC